MNAKSVATVVVVCLTLRSSAHTPSRVFADTVTQPAVSSDIRTAAPVHVLTERDGLIGWWKGNDNANDSMGRLNGTVHGAIQYVPAVFGDGFLFNGQDTGVTFPDVEPLKLAGPFTITAWVNIQGYPDSGKMNNEIFFRGDDRSGLDPYYLTFNSDKKIHLGIDSGTEQAEVIAPVPQGQFVFLAGVYDRAAGVLCLYVNGVDAGEHEAAFGVMHDLVGDQHPGVGLGCNNDFPISAYHFGFQGVINDLRVYNRPLSPDTIATMYLAGVESAKKNGVVVSQ